MLEVAEQSGVTLIHENEKDIYGDTGDRCLDLAVNLPALGHCFDFSNFVQCDEDTLECWNKLRDYVVYFDVKDAIAGSGVVVGASVVAPYGGEVVGLLSTAVHARLTVPTLRGMHFAYPTFHRVVERALRDTGL